MACRPKPPFKPEGGQGAVAGATWRSIKLNSGLLDDLCPLRHALLADWLSTMLRGVLLIAARHLF